MNVSQLLSFARGSNDQLAGALLFPELPQLAFDLSQHRIEGSPSHNSIIPTSAAVISPTMKSPSWLVNLLTAFFRPLPVV
jgi:hypothetical protein